jgi:hypothetical protein
MTEDVQKVRQFHTNTKNKGAMGQEALDKKGSQYWNSVARRFIPEPETLKAALDELWQEFAGTAGLDPATGQPLFGELTPLVLDAIKELIDNGNFCGKATASMVSHGHDSFAAALVAGRLHAMMMHKCRDHHTTTTMHS